MRQAFSYPSPEPEGSGASAQFKRKRETNKKKEGSIKGMAEDTSFFDKSLEILSNYRETGLPVSTYWEALGLIKQKTSHEAYWFCGANEEDRLYWLMRQTPKECTQAFQDWKSTMQSKPKNDEPKLIKKETDADNVILVDDPAVPTQITLKVRGIFDGKTVYYFKINPHARLEKLKQAYCDHVHVDHHSLRFLFDGCPLRGEKTPNQMEMKDGDEIDAIMVIGGPCGTCRVMS